MLYDLKNMVCMSVPAPRQGHSRDEVRAVLAFSRALEIAAQNAAWAGQRNARRRAQRRAKRLARRARAAAC